MSLHFVLKLQVDDIPGSPTTQEHSDVFEDRFSRCRPLLTFLAFRILACNEEGAEAVQNCRITASRNPPRFVCEGAFRSWLARILIDEALAILRQKGPRYPSPQNDAGSDRRVILSFSLIGECRHPHWHTCLLNPMSARLGSIRQILVAHQAGLLSRTGQ